MPTVRVLEILAAPPTEVWQHIVDVEAYPEFMVSVTRTEVLRTARRAAADGSGRLIDEAVVGWETTLHDAVLRWVERELRDPDRLRVEFDQVSGDLARFDGHWQLSRTPDDLTQVELTVHFEIGLELLRDVLDPYAREAIEDNSRAMLRALGKRAARASNGR